MSTWYQATVKYGMMVEGKYKTVSEQYLLNCVSLSDLEATCYEILASRIKHPDVDSFSKPRPTDVYKMCDGPLSEVEGDFYLVKVACDFGDSKTVDKHILNADSPAQAEERVRERLKNALFDYEVTHSDKTKILGIYDKSNIVWVEDFKKRMDDLEAQGRKEANFNQTEINFDKPVDDGPKSDPNAVTAMVIRTDVVSVDAEDLGNGQHDDSEQLEHVRELGTGNSYLLNEPTEEPAEVED